VAVCLGTRPEAIKMAPVIARLEETDALHVSTIVTGQHRELLQQALDVFGIEPDVDLDLMAPEQDLAQLTGRAVSALGPVLDRLRPDAVLVHGDTTTTLCGALAAAYAQVPVGHVEAGLRSHDPASPFPEELNRRMVTQLARWHFAPTPAAAKQLVADGVPRAGIDVTGNTVIDALMSIDAEGLDDALPAPPPRRRRILVTMHRRETHGDVQRSLCAMLAHLVAEHPVEVVLPLHPNPAVRAEVEGVLGNRRHVQLLEALDYRSFVALLRTADLVLTDSGGLQEEAPSFDVPVLVLRERTERPEGVAAGCARVVGTDAKRVQGHVLRLLEDDAAYTAMAASPNPYGDGRAAERIVRRLESDLHSDESMLHSTFALASR